MMAKDFQGKYIQYAASTDMSHSWAIMGWGQRIMNKPKYFILEVDDCQAAILV